MSTAEISSRLEIPPDFAKASPRYRLRVWTAMLGLILFVLLYVGLAGWFTYTAYRMIAGVFAGGDGAVAAFFAAIPSAFLAIFMWKALFFIRRGADDPGLEITREDQPELFDFLCELADELGAPRPHRVFLSPNVNASVFHDLSILNFFLPTKKNLIIGLGLVNVLTRSELKAVLAHEFGHFAQRSMAVGRWVYVGEQIAGHIIAKRDFLDRTLDFISSIDIRIAWIGWIMRTIVWSIRSLMETAFRWVVIAHRALSREMEFQADLVAVSATGSDALIHALFRLQPADEDWERSLGFANAQLVKEKKVTDLFAVQTRMGEHMRRVLNDPTLGTIPPAPAGDPAQHRLFSEQIAQPPKMWSTHPPNTEREANAKKIYIPARLNEESAWTIFKEPQQLREQVTAKLFEGIPFEKEPQPMSTDEALAVLDEQFSHESYDIRYRGAYLGRPITIHAAKADQLQAEGMEEDRLASSLSELYPENLQDSLTDWRNIEEEIALLEAVESGYLDASGGVIRHRGEIIPKAEVSELIDRLKKERDEILAAIEQHDEQCRTVHAAAAKRIQQGWQEYHHSLIRLLHYAEHCEANLNDAHGQLANITMMSTAGGRVSKKKLQKILQSANDLQGVMANLDEQTTKVDLPEPILKELEVKSWREAIDKLELPPANEHNIGPWIEVVDSWVIPMTRRLGALRKAALAELLRAESEVAEYYANPDAVKPAPEPAKIPRKYETRQRGTERVRQTKLDWWSRFTLAEGAGPAILRFLVAATIVAGVVLAGMYVGQANVIVYNGLSIPVDVAVGDKKISVLPFQHREVSLLARRNCPVEARTKDGREIESFAESIDKAFANYVYNVAGAAPMSEFVVVYGRGAPRDPHHLGFPRWHNSSARDIFTQPPREADAGTTRRVLHTDARLPPAFLLSLAQNPSEQERVIRAHARWDSADSQHITNWLTRASQLDGFKEILAERFAANSNDVPALRVEQDTADPLLKPAVLLRHRQKADEHPDNPDWQYIGIRAMPNGPEQDRAFLAAVEKWPNNVWLNYAVAFIHANRADWEKALAHYQKALDRVGPVFDPAAIQVARIRRLLAKNNPANLNDLKRSFEVKQYLAFETGENLQNTPEFAYSLLNKGQVEEAFRRAGGHQADLHLRVLLAASVGAEKDWQDRVLQTHPKEFQNPTLLLYVMALAYRRGESYERYFDEFAKLYPQDRPSPLDYFKKLAEKGKLDPALNDTIDDLDAMARGLVLAAGIVMFPDQATEEQKRMARALLFVFERPAI